MKKLNKKLCEVTPQKDAVSHINCLVIESEGGACPYQAYGRIDGYPCYFRSRGEAWSFRVRLDEKQPIDPLEWDDGEQWTHVEQYGPWPSAGYITKEEAHAFMDKAIKEFRSHHPSNTKKAGNSI